MKVMQINCVYGHGSTGVLVRDLHQHLLKQGIRSAVIYGRGPQCREQGIEKCCPEWYSKANNLISRFRGDMYGGCRLSTWYLTERIRKEKPDVVHLHCLNGYFVNIYRLIGWLKKRKIKTVLTLHAEFMYTANCAHALDCEKWKNGCGNCPRFRQETKSLFRDGTARSFQKMEAAFRGFSRDLTVVSVSPWLRERAEASRILRGMDHRVVFNGVDTAVFRPGAGVPAEKTVFHATAFFSDDPGHLKGGWTILELARRLGDLPVRFLVAGSYQLHGPVPENVTLLGEVRDREALAAYYANASLTLLASRREAFSMVCAESLCCGTPVAGFRAGGPESIALEPYSQFVPWGDLDALEEAVRRWLKREPDRNGVRAGAEAVYTRERMAEQYQNLYREIVHDPSY